MNTIPPAKQGAPMAAGASGGEMSPAPNMVRAASFDSILAASRKQLPEHAAKDIEALEKQLGTIHDSSGMVSVFTEIAKQWQEHKQLPVAAWYMAKAAKLENSEKKLNFAGQFFLDLMHDAGSASVQVWEAQEAVACFQQSLAINPANDTVKMAMAAGYIEGTGETMQGVQLLLGITREKPENIPANLMLGKLAIQSGQYDKAISRFETVLKQEPENTEATYFLAEAYKGKGDKEKAIALLEKCKKLVNKPAFSKDIDAYINSFK